MKKDDREYIRTQLRDMETRMTADPNDKGYKIGSIVWFIILLVGFVVGVIVCLCSIFIK